MSDGAVRELPVGWAFDPDYSHDGTPTWWHDDCPTPTVLDDGAELGGIAVEERLHGHLVAVRCTDCDASISVTRRPSTKVVGHLGETDDGEYHEPFPVTWNDGEPDTKEPS